MMSRKGVFCKLTLLIALFRICQCWDFKTGGVLEDVLMDIDRNVLKRTTTSLLACAQECLRRKTCHFFRAKHLRQFNSGGFKCSMDVSGGNNSTYQVEKKCNVGKSELELKDFIHVYPSRLAGVCSDHTCDQRRVCTASGHGTYKCDLSEMTSSNKKDKQRLRKQMREKQRENRRLARLAAKKKNG